MQDTIKKTIKWKLCLRTHQQFARHQKKELQTDISFQRTPEESDYWLPHVEKKRKHTIDTLIDSEIGNCTHWRSAKHFDIEN